MKLFHQLSISEQEAAINHCINLVIQNTIENGLQLETTDDEEGAGLRAHLYTIMDELEAAQFSSSEEKVAFLMSDSVFSDTVSELGMEMSRNAFYHDSSELVLFTDSLIEESYDSEIEEDNSPKLLPPKKDIRFLN